MAEPTSGNTNPAGPTPTPNKFAADVGQDWDKAAQRFHDVTHHARNIQTENETLKKHLAVLTERLESSAARPSGGTDYLRTISDQTGIQPEIFAEAFKQVAAPMIQATFKPVTDALDARTKMASQAPEYIAKEGEIYAWAASQPDLINEINQLTNAGFSMQAQKLLYREWQASKVVDQKGPAPDDPATKAAAGLPPSGSPGDPNRRQTATTEDQDKDFYRRLDLARQTRNARYIAKDLFEGTNWLAPPGMAG